MQTSILIEATYLQFSINKSDESKISEVQLKIVQGRT